MQIVHRVQIALHYLHAIEINAVVLLLDLVAVLGASARLGLVPGRKVVVVDPKAKVRKAQSKEDVKNFL